MANAKNNNKLNLLIGKTARMNAQLVGLQITNGNLIALAFSIIQISAGIMIVLFPKASNFASTLPGQYQTAALIALESAVGLLGVPLAVLVERLTLGGLKRVYAAYRAIGKLKDEHEARLDRGEIEDDKKAAAEKLLKRRASRHTNSRIAGFIAAGVGSLISMALGSLLWDQVFSSAGVHLEGLAQYITYVGPFLVAVIIPFTFADSELSKDTMDDTIKDSIHSTVVLEEVLQNEGRAMQIDLAMKGIADLRNDVNKTQQAITKVQDALVTSLENAVDLVALPPARTVAALPAPGQTALDAEYAFVNTPAPVSTLTPVSVALPRISAPFQQVARNTITLSRLTALPAPAIETQEDAPEIALVNDFERALYSDLLQADQADLIANLFQLHAAQADLEEVITLLQDAYPDSADQFTPECVDRVWRKIVHESDTEPLTATRNVARNVTTASAPKTAQRRARQTSSAVSKSRSAMTTAKARKLEDILRADPEISNARLGALLSVSPNTAGAWKKKLLAAQQ